MKAKMYKYLQAVKIPKIQYQRFESPQTPFGNDVEEYDQEDYAKHIEIERIKRSYQDMQTSHPLLL
jgi:hypothetical protein